MFKNLTPRQIATYASLLISILFLALFFIFDLLDWISAEIFSYLILAPVFFLIAYLVILFFLEKFIYRKIKLIYKYIHKSKLSQKEPMNLSSDILNEVEKEVSDWASDQRREIENLKSLGNYRREFLGNVAHELKTPLFSIEGYIHTLLDGGLHDDKINQKYLSRASKNVERLHTILDDLDAISKLEAGKLVLDMQDFSIKELTEEVFEEVELLASEQKVKLSFKDGAFPNFIVKADRENIRQVLVNLMTNSIKYGKEGGYTKVSFYDMHQHILVEVADDGVGIDKEHLAHLFDRFYRVDKSRSRHQGGSGLGLSIVKHIIEAHQQTINVRSVKGVGSTFGFTLEKA
jgi:two-component system phosphate regulon sensor histidine kinase PhoR